MHELGSVFSILWIVERPFSFKMEPWLDKIIARSNEAKLTVAFHPITVLSFACLSLDPDFAVDNDVDSAALHPTAMPCTPFNFRSGLVLRISSTPGRANIPELNSSYPCLVISVCQLNSRNIRATATVGTDVRTGHCCSQPDWWLGHLSPGPITGVHLSGGGGAGVDQPVKLAVH